MFWLPPTDIHLPLTHWATPFTFLEVGVFCRETIKKQNYLNGFLGDVRSLHALEIAHLYDHIENNLTSKALLIGFSQVTEMNTIRKFFIAGKELTNRHIEISSQQLQQENLPTSLL